MTAYLPPIRKQMRSKPTRSCTMLSWRALFLMVAFLGTDKVTMSTMEKKKEEINLNNSFNGKEVEILPQRQTESNAVL